MGSSGSGTKINMAKPAVTVEETAVPAVAREVSRQTEEMQGNQAERRNRLRGIRSTYSRFASDSAANGTRATLG